MNLDSTLAVTNTCPKDGVHLCPRQPHHATGSLYWQPMLLYQHLSQLSLRRRPYNFRCRTSLMAACSSARSAYIRLSLACSASSSRSCRTSDTDAPPYLLRHLKNVALLTPCVRHRSGTGTPLSASRRMPTIWVSLNLDFRMTAPWTRAVYVQLSIDRGSLRDYVLTAHAIPSRNRPGINRREHHLQSEYASTRGQR